MKAEYLYAGGLGLSVGAITSCLLHINSEKTADLYSREIFGINSTTLIKSLVIFFTTIILAIAGWLSILIRDTEYPSKYPLLFILETFLAGFLPACVILIMYYSRKRDMNNHFFINFSLITLKLIIAHLFFQYSGIYSSIFKNS